ncbi:hypothetical protein PQO03_03425 [Lentisphaera profundi]|uniref:Thaumarchaeal output domain-containing protein n=1 Tax=Lentisphaera profundi TaxID=1658616 RepID=A0ABY7VS28_9BACT|nr:hypothetical protein [Lentisphaera profundi]WDE97011.1 hypothetical protein PQO03_03425 [Lentisphaera profundi]
MLIDQKTEELVLKALSYYAQGGENIKPSRDINSDCAYSYTDFIQKCEGIAVDGFLLLDELRERGFLRKIINDRLFLCDKCSSWHINLREVCPDCSSLDWKQKRLYHHFSCGYVGLEDEFKVHSYAELHCPKCEQVMRHIGLDYEKPTQSFFCYTCEHIFDEHQTKSLCISCGEQSDLEKMELKEIYSYQLTAKAYQAIEKGSLKETSVEDLIKNKATELYTYDFLIFLLDQQRQIAQECGDHLTACIISGPENREFIDYTKTLIKPSFFLSEWKGSFIIVASRGRSKDHIKAFKILLDNFQEIRKHSLVGSTFDFELELDANKQFDLFLQTSVSDRSKFKEGGFCEN